MADTPPVFIVKMTPYELGRLLNSSDDGKGNRYQMRICFRDNEEGGRDEVITVSGIGDLELGERFTLEVELTKSNGKERK